MNEQSQKSIRLDKWLDIARIVKTRSKATKACAQGKVKLNDQPAKPSKMVKIGDRISVKFKIKKRTFDVLGIVYRNIKAEDARLLYREHEPDPKEKEAEDIRNLFYKATKLRHPKRKGRPTKKERRELEKFLNKSKR